MNDEKRTMEEQDHPLKNTDHAFVKVGKDGEPVIPETTKEDNTDKAPKEHKTTLDHR